MIAKKLVNIKYQEEERNNMRTWCLIDRCLLEEQFKSSMSKIHKAKFPSAKHLRLTQTACWKVNSESLRLAVTEGLLLIYNSSFH